MRKSTLILSLGMIAYLFVSCYNHGTTHPDLRGEDPYGGCIYFFQFKDTSYLNKIILWDATPDRISSKYGKRINTKYWMPLYPKSFEGEAIFGTRASGATEIEYMDGHFYTLEDVLESPKFIALKGGYYLCYPFTALEAWGHYLNADWKDFYTTDFYNTECIRNPYRIRYNISERTLANLTQKSTCHFPRKNPEMITIDDVVETLNDLIETNRIDEFCYQVYHY